MALKTGSLILASDVGINLYNTVRQNTISVQYASGAKTKERYYIYHFAPGHRVTFSYGKWPSKSDITISYYTRDYLESNDDDEDNDDGTWTFIGSYTDAVSFSLTNSTRDFKQVMFKVDMEARSALWPNTDSFKLTTSHSTTSAIAEAGMPIRTINSTYTDWLDQGSSLVTLDLYENGRVGYVEYSEENDNEDGFVD